MRTLCLPVGLSDTDIDELEGLLGNRTKLKKGDALFHNGAPFTALYAVKLGSLKTTVLSDDGREQVAGYHMAGDLLGLDGMGDDRHGCEAIALEDSEAVRAAVHAHRGTGAPRPGAAAQPAQIHVARNRARPSA